MGRWREGGNMCEFEVISLSGKASCGKDYIFDNILKPLGCIVGPWLTTLRYGLSVETSPLTKKSFIPNLLIFVIFSKRPVQKKGVKYTAIQFG